jgi:hypothetical protein
MEKIYCCKGISKNDSVSAPLAPTGKCSSEKKGESSLLSSEGYLTPRGWVTFQTGFSSEPSPKFITTNFIRKLPKQALVIH